MVVFGMHMQVQWFEVVDEEHFPPAFSRLSISSTSRLRLANSWFFMLPPFLRCRAGTSGRSTGTSIKYHPIDGRSNDIATYERAGHAVSFSRKHHERDERPPTKGPR